MSEQNTKTTEFNGRNFFSFLYRTRIKVAKGDVTIVNLSLLFSILSLLCAPWLVIIGAIVAVLLGYRFSLVKNAQGFSGNVNEVFRGAADNVKSAVNSFAGDATHDDSANQNGGNSSAQ